jgi:hypothetical protein
MKNIYFLIIALMATISVSNAQSSSVVVFAQDGEKFWLIMDGVRQNDKPEANVKVTGLTNPNYRMKIIFDDSKIPSIDQNVYTQQHAWEEGEAPKFMDASYVIRKNNKGKYIIRLNSVQEAKSTPVAGQSVIAFHATENPKETAPAKTTSETKGANTTTTTTTTQGTTTTANPNVNTGVNVNMGVNGMNMNVNFQDPVMQENISMGVNTNMGVNTTTTHTTTTTTTTSSSNTRPQQTQVQQVNTAPQPVETAAPQKCSVPMAAGDFTNAKNSIQKQSFADSKMKTAQQITRNNCLSTSQVIEIVEMFSFETQKLEFAKFAYDFTTDTKNYFMINDVFSFSSSSDDLNKFLEKKSR